MERLTEKCWRNMDPWECCGQDYYCKRDCHEDGGCNKGCVVPKLYDRLAAYEDTGLTPEEVIDLKGSWNAACKAYGFNPTIPQPNPPLTLEELREMDGEPVWLAIGFGGQYDIFCGSTVCGIYNFYEAALPGDKYGTGWLAYRRRPEEGKT